MLVDMFHTLLLLLLDYGQVSNKSYIWKREKRHLLEGGAYFDLIVKWCGTYLRPNTYNRKYGKAEDAQ